MNLINQENQNTQVAEEQALRELKDLIQAKDRRLEQLAIQRGEKEAPAYFARYDENLTIVLN